MKDKDLILKTLNDIEKLLHATTDENLYDFKTEGEIAQAMRLKMLMEMREEIYRIGNDIHHHLLSFKVAVIEMLKVGEIGDRLNQEIGRLIGEN